MMNRIFRLAMVIALMMVFDAARSQELGFGLKGGLNLTNLKVDDPDASYDSRAGYHAGLFLRGKFNNVAIQPELLLFTQRNEIDYLGGVGSATNSFTYLSVPVMFKFYLVSGLNIQAGPQFGFLLDGEQKFSDPLLSGKRDITDAYKKSDVSVSLGGGFDFGFGLNLDVRYNLGVKDINDTADGEEARSRVFLVSVGWNFVK